MDTIKVTEQVKYNFPDPVLLTDGGVLEKWAEQMQRVGEAVLYTHWRTSIKMGGVLFRKIYEAEPTNPDIKKMLAYGKAKKTQVGGPESISSSSSVSDSSSVNTPVKTESEREYDEQEEKERKQDVEKKRIEDRQRREERELQKIDTEAKRLQENLKSRGERDEDIDEMTRVFRQKKRNEYLENKIERAMNEEKEIETIDLTIETPFSQKGIYSGAVQDVLGLGGWEIGEDLEQKFYRFDKKDFETPEHMGARKRFWDFMVGSVTGPDPHQPLFCAHLVKQSDKYDIKHLFKLVTEFLTRENFQTVGTKIEKFFSIRPQNNESIFSFITRVRESVSQIERSDHIAQSVGESVKIPKKFVLWKILGALSRYEQYKFFCAKKCF